MDNLKKIQRITDLESDPQKAQFDAMVDNEEQHNEIKEEISDLEDSLVSKIDSLVFPDSRPEIKQVVETIKNLVIPFDDSAKKSELLEELGKITKLLSKEEPKTDLKPIFGHLTAIEKLLGNLSQEDKEIDLKPIIKAINEIKPFDITKYTKDDKVKVYIDEEQLKKLKPQIFDRGGASFAILRNAQGDITSSNPLPVTVSSLPLPSGAATEATLALIKNTDGIKKITDTVTVQGTVTANTARQAASTSAVTQVASSASNVTLKASNANRLGLIITNDSTQILYVKFGATASTTSYTYKVFPSAIVELTANPIYTGIVDGIWASANGNAYVTEITA